MRPAALLAVSLALAACADGPAEVAATLPESASFTVGLDSLRVDEPARAFRVAVAAPQVRRKAGTPRAPAVQAANAVLRDSVRALADDLRPEAPPRYADPTPISARGGPTRMWLTDAVFSALVEVTVRAGDAPETRVLLPLTVDLETGEPVAPADLFAPDTPWADTLAAHTARGVARQLRGRGPFGPAGLDALRAGRVALTLSAGGLTVHVAPYQLSPEPSAFHVDVPLAAVAPFARPGGLIDRLSPAADPRGARPPDRAPAAD